MRPDPTLHKASRSLAPYPRRSYYATTVPPEQTYAVAILISRWRNRGQEKMPRADRHRKGGRSGHYVGKWMCALLRRHSGRIATTRMGKRGTPVECACVTQVIKA